MRQNETLLRELLLHIRDQPRQHDPVTTQSLGGGYTAEEIIEHLNILSDDGLIEGQFVNTFGQSEFFAKRVTSRGHQYLEGTRPLTKAERALAWLKPALTPKFIIKTLLACLAIILTLVSLVYGAQ